jgi:hypothetical protein
LRGRALAPRLEPLLLFMRDGLRLTLVERGGELERTLGDDDGVDGREMVLVRCGADGVVLERARRLTDEVECAARRLTDEVERGRCAEYAVDGWRVLLRLA